LTHIHTHARTHARAHTHMRNTHAHTHAYTHLYTHTYTHINTYTFFKRKQITSVIEQHHLMIIKLISFYPKILVLSQRNRPSDGLGSHSLSKGLTQRISLRVTTVDCSTNCWQSRLVSSQEQIKITVDYSPLY